MDDCTQFLNELIQTDNYLVDRSAKYIRSSYPTELPVSSFLDNQKKGWWIFTSKRSIKSFFRPCKKVVKYNWDLVSTQWDEINSQNSDIDTACCPHTEHLIEDLGNSVNTDQYKQLTFYHIVQDVVIPVSKRIGESYRVYKIYAYCPICFKIFCIGGIEKNYTRINLFECNFFGALLSARVSFKVNNLLPSKVCSNPLEYDTCFEVWKLKKEILKTKYDIIWYSPLELHPGVRF